VEFFLNYFDQLIIFFISLIILKVPKPNPT